MRPIRDGDKGAGGGGVKTGDRRQPGRPSKAAVDRRQNNRKLRQCPLGTVQRLQYYAIAVPTAMQNRVTKTMSVAPPSGNN